MSSTHAKTMEALGRMRRRRRTTERHELTYENQKLQGKSPGANGGSVQRLVTPNAPANRLNPGENEMSSNRRCRIRSATSGETNRCARRKCQAWNPDAKTLLTSSGVNSSCGRTS